jgi:propionate CoA-transferase
MELKGGMTANLGFGISAMVPRILLEEGHPEAVTWAIEQGAVGGMPLTGFAFGCASNADAFVPSPQQFIYFQGAGFDMSFLSFLEVDVEGNVNVSKLGKKPYLTAGCGGFVDITAHAKKIVFSGWFEAGPQVDLDRIRHFASPNRASSPRWLTSRTCHLLRRPRAGTGAGGAVHHRTLRDPADRPGLVATEIMPGIDPRATSSPPAQGRVKVAENAADHAAVAAGRRADGVAAMSAGVHLTSTGGMAELRLDNPAS